MSTPKLSLCMTTYNRAPLLKQALDAVLTQITAADASLLEVVILDNASIDNTTEVVEMAKGQVPHIPLRYLRHPENIGMDRNFMEAIRAAQGEYVFLLSDDDFLLPGAVSTLLSLIQTYPDFDGFSLNVRGFLHSPDEESPAWIKLTQDQVVTEPTEALRLMNATVGYMSILAFKKSLIEDRLQAGHYQDKVGTCFLESYVFLDAMASGHGVVITAQPLVASRAENCAPWNYFRVFVTELHAMMVYAKRLGYSHEVVHRIEADNLIGVRHFVSRVKIYGHGGEYWRSRRDAINRLFRVYRFHPYLWLVIVPLMFFPRPLRPLVFFTSPAAGPSGCRVRGKSDCAGIQRDLRLALYYGFFPAGHAWLLLPPQQNPELCDAGNGFCPISLPPAAGARGCEAASSGF